VVAVREALRRFSAYDRSELRRGLSQELIALKGAKREIPTQVKKKKDELERYVASYQSEKSLGPIFDRLHPHIDTSSEEYWRLREFKAKSSAKHARLQEEISALTSELAAIDRRAQVLAGVVSGLGEN